MKSINARTFTMIAVTLLSLVHVARASGSEHGAAAGEHGAAAGHADSAAAHGNEATHPPAAHDEPAEGHGASAGPPAKVIEVRDLPADFQVPPSLWDQLLSHSSAKEMKASVEGQEDEVQGSSVLFRELTVRLTEKNPGVLREPVMEIRFPKGGGQLDLSKFTSGNPGTFFVHFDVGPGIENPTFEAFHLSKARKRKVDERIFGGGCKSFTKITKLIKADGHGPGLPFNTTRDLHISSLGGHFLFSWSDGDATTVTQVKFFDSTKPQYSCQNAGPANRDDVEPGTNE